MKVIKDSVHISGMTCIMCQNTIESALNSTNGIINAKVDYKKEKAQVEYDSDIVSITDIINVIKEKGYEACNEEEYCRSSDDYIRKISIVVIIIMLYILISETGIINMLVPGRFAVVGIISIVFAAIAGIILAGKISVPVKAATRAAKDIARGNYNNRINTDICTMELSELGNAVNHMAESLDNQEMLRRRLTSDVAHELRTPVANVSSNIEAIIEGVLEPTNERLSSCYNELERITGIITELEKLRQIEGENMILHIGHVDIYELAKEVKLIFENEMSKKNIRCDIIGEHIDVCVDKDKMSQVLNNLISNAVKYTDNYGNIQITVIQENENVVITVKDNGCGIDDNDIQYIFERFYRTDKSRNRSTGGAGIGLTITRAIVQLHGGTIHVESKKGVGSLFKVTIPANKQI
ncbi:phosphate regulon sensor protein [Eubacterium sp. CAG:252]|nr:phosphate regulon sensor protein [Eubacterium sp. CAG:252]